MYYVFPVSEDKNLSLQFYFSFLNISETYNNAFLLSHMHPESVPVLIIFSFVNDNGQVASCY